MAKKILIIETSLRTGSNSDILAESFAKGAKDAGNDVEIVSLKDKKIGFCTGCFACQKLGKCVIPDDANVITEKILEAEVVVWATPIYYYEMSGQMKTMIDRANSLYPRDYKFREVYLLSTAAEDEAYTDEKAVSGVNGWIDCFEKAEFKGKVFAGGVNERGEIAGHKALNEAYALGKSI
ncbi:flavodoxin family protein [Butyrivibrio sp. DSM 10294]|uniref:flavodoxin family protein n=1 Tax=Butyrivibrio sp. DSM 10294 TaxID=2972457 RepID=UPI00234EEDE8|nr:flavodoxin family protein [Butyrivibrio sp. DSM 10294]MDC7292002.1 flavodoxin family protein [Butyrivibrio sp. DSM 10294]